MSKKEQTSTKNRGLMVGLIATMILILVALLAYIVVIKISEHNKAKKTMADFEEVFNGKELSIIYYMHTGCEFCAMQEPFLEQVAKDYDLDYLTVDTNDISKKDNQEIVDTLGIRGRTPTLIIVQRGEVKAIQEGYLEGHKLVEFLVKSEILDEKSTYKPEENLTFIEYDKFVELKESKEASVVVLGSATCEYCKGIRPILSNISKSYDIPIYYLGLDYLRTNSSKFKEDLTEMKYDEEAFVSTGKFTTPSILIIKNNKVVSYLKGYLAASDYVKYFKEQKIIKE